jgi:hypothetical protein
MSRTYISSALRRFVSERASRHCEYCGVHEDDVLLPHQPDHIIAEQHGGKTEESNLALACVQCHLPKGPNIASIDFQTGKLTPLYHPRKDVWEEHFQLEGAVVSPKTPVGRVTVRLLMLNHLDRVQFREKLIKAGRYP